jgi:molybdate transport system substrate-binding protein
MVLLSSDALQRLMEAGHVQANSDCDWAYSNVAVAVPAGHAIPPIHTAAELKQLVLAANKLSYSTGPSGHYLSQLFSQWGIADALKQRIVVPPPGVPVASLLAQGEVDVGFQQRSELMHQPGIALVGDLPDEVAHTTVFSAGVGLAAVNDPARLQAVRDFFHFISAQEQSDCRSSFGMR